MFIIVTNKENKCNDQVNVKHNSNQEHDIISGTIHVFHFQLNIKYVLYYIKI